LSITAALRINDGNAVIRYNFIGDNSEIVSVGKEYAMLSRARLVNDGTLMVPVRDSMEMFGLNVDWNQAEQCAYVSVPSEAYPPDGLSIIEKPGEGRYSAENLPPIEDDISDDGGHTKGAYLGRFKITHYCPCDICNGGWGAYTAWAGELIPGQSVAVNQNIIPKLSWIYIDGYGYRRAEDTGSGIGEYQIDVAVADHETAIRLGVEYKDVYAAQ
jgi:3D (Asp-Asp-Asp) domain-containing protein